MKWLLAIVITLFIIYGELGADSLSVKFELGINDEYCTELESEIEKLELQTMYHEGLLKIYVDYFEEIQKY